MLHVFPISHSLILSPSLCSLKSTNYANCHQPPDTSLRSKYSHSDILTSFLHMTDQYSTTGKITVSCILICWFLYRTREVEKSNWLLVNEFWTDYRPWLGCEVSEDIDETVSPRSKPSPTAIVPTLVAANMPLCSCVNEAHDKKKFETWSLLFLLWHSYDTASV